MSITKARVANTASTESFVARLRTSSAALLHRQGRWHLLSPAGASQSVLPSKATALIEKLIQNGRLVCGDDYLFRLRDSPVLAVTNTDESPLAGILRNKKQAGECYFDHDHFRAGERLRKDYGQTHLAQRVTVNYAAAEGGSSRHWHFSDNAVEKLQDAVFAARRRVHDALDAVGPELSGLLLQVCCLISGLEDAERALSLPRRSAKLVLAMGLSRLARHYGFKPRLRHAGPSRIGHWAAEGTRPGIAPAEAAPMPPTPEPHRL